MNKHGKVTSQSFMKRERQLKLKTPRLFRLINPFNFIWLAAIAAVLMTLQIKGTPHVLFEYTYVGSKQFKTSCTYVGLHPQRVNPIGSDCPIFRLLQAES